MQAGVGRPHDTAAQTQGCTYDLRLRTDRAESSRADLRSHGFAHVGQRARDATANHDQLRVENIEKRRDRDSQVMTGGREGLEREAVATASLGGQSSHRKILFRIYNLQRQWRPWTQTEAILDQTAQPRRRGV